jgi:hypothetical protein
MACAAALFAIARSAIADPNDLASQSGCTNWTSAVPQSMIATSTCPRVSWEVSVGDMFRIVPYRFLETQNFKTQSDTMIPAGGAVINSRLRALPGKPVLALDIGGRNPAIRWNPGRDPIWSTSLSLGYQMNMRLELGPHVTQVWNTAGEQIVRTRTYGFYLRGSF